MTANLLNITRATEIAKYYYSMGVDYHTSIVQFPQPLNPKLLPPALKEKVTNDWNELINGDREWMESYNHSQKFVNRSFERWKKFGDNVINYMNGEDWYHYWDDFIEYANAQDQHHGTNILDVYPEFRKYWHEV